MRARNENANKCAIDFYTVSIRWKHADRMLAERPELATNTQRARREIDTFCVHPRQRTVDVPSAYAYRAADARNVRIACAYSVLAAYGPYVGIRREFLCVHKISRRTQRALAYECVWHRALNARSTTSRRASDVHQRMTTNDKKSSYAGIRRAHTLICDGHLKDNHRKEINILSNNIHKLEKQLGTVHLIFWGGGGAWNFFEKNFLALILTKKK